MRIQVSPWQTTATGLSCARDKSSSSIDGTTADATAATTLARRGAKKMDEVDDNDKSSSSCSSRVVAISPVVASWWCGLEASNSDHRVIDHQQRKAKRRKKEDTYVVDDDDDDEDDDEVKDIHRSSSSSPSLVLTSQHCIVCLSIASSSRSGDAASTEEQEETMGGTALSSLSSSSLSRNYPSRPGTSYLQAVATGASPASSPAASANNIAALVDVTHNHHRRVYAMQSDNRRIVSFLDNRNDGHGDNNNYNKGNDNDDDIILTAPVDPDDPHATAASMQIHVTVGMMPSSSSILPHHQRKKKEKKKKTVIDETATTTTLVYGSINKSHKLYVGRVITSNNAATSTLLLKVQTWSSGALPAPIGKKTTLEHVATIAANDQSSSSSKPAVALLTTGSKKQKATTATTPTKIDLQSSSTNTAVVAVAIYQLLVAQNTGTLVVYRHDMQVQQQQQQQQQQGDDDEDFIRRPGRRVPSASLSLLGYKEKVQNVQLASTLPGSPLDNDNAAKEKDTLAVLTFATINATATDNTINTGTTLWMVVVSLATATVVRGPWKLSAPLLPLSTLQQEEDSVDENNAIDTTNDDNVQVGGLGHGLVAVRRGAQVSIYDAWRGALLHQWPLTTMAMSASEGNSYSSSGSHSSRMWHLATDATRGLLAVAYASLGQWHVATRRVQVDLERYYGATSVSPPRLSLAASLAASAGSALVMSRPCVVQAGVEAAVSANHEQQEALDALEHVFHKIARSVQQGNAPPYEASLLESYKVALDQWQNGQTDTSKDGTSEISKDASNQQKDGEAKKASMAPPNISSAFATEAACIVARILLVVSSPSAQSATNRDHCDKLRHEARIVMRDLIATDKVRARRLFRVVPPIASSPSFHVDPEDAPEEHIVVAKLMKAWGQVREEEENEPFCTSLGFALGVLQHCLDVSERHMVALAYYLLSKASAKAAATLLLRRPLQKGRPPVADRWRTRSKQFLEMDGNSKNCKTDDTKMEEAVRSNDGSSDEEEEVDQEKLGHQLILAGASLCLEACVSHSMCNETLLRRALVTDGIPRQARVLMIQQLARQLSPDTSVLDHSSSARKAKKTKHDKSRRILVFLAALCDSLGSPQNDSEADCLEQLDEALELETGASETFLSLQTVVNKAYAKIIADSKSKKKLLEGVDMLDIAMVGKEAPIIYEYQIERLVF